MKVFKSNKEYINWFEEAGKNFSIGIAPTMGNIHVAHLSLLQKAIEENDVGVITIYVNPTQFGEGEDFDNYPRTFEDDLEKISKLETANKELIVYAPSEEDIYPDGFDNFLKAGSIANELEGSVRPTHFDGVVTVVNRLFEILKPTKAYFGKKDYQQLRLIEKMANELHPNVSIVGMPIIRESSGLAMSSRNNYLNDDQKSQALILKKTLDEIKNSVKEFKDIKTLNNHVQSLLESDKRFNYISLRNQKTLAEISSIKEDIVILGNFQIGNTRLLDNLEV